MEDQKGLASAVIDEATVDVLAGRMIGKLSYGLQQAQRDQVGRAPKPDAVAAGSIARVCHEANRAYCLMLGDDSQPAWDDAPEWQRASAVEGVLKHLSQGFLDPEQSHNAWMAHKLRDGWRYGEAKDPEAKTHPCLLPFRELPTAQQLKDHLFGRIVDALRPLAFPGAEPSPFEPQHGGASAAY